MSESNILHIANSLNLGRVKKSEVSQSCWLIRPVVIKVSWLSSKRTHTERERERERDWNLLSRRIRATAWYGNLFPYLLATVILIYLLG